MSLEQAITDHAAAIRELAAAIRATTGGADKPAAADKPTPKADPKPETKKSDAKPASSPSGAERQSADPKAGAQDTDYAAVKAAILAVSKAKGREPTMAMLSRFGVTNGTELKTEQYADVVSMAKGVLDGTIDPQALCVAEEEMA